MSVPLLQTKLHSPPLGSELVGRPRLIERLEKGKTGKLTLVSAPAGFGKTTLLCEWVHAAAAASRRKAEESTELKDPNGAPSHIAWVSLDEGDNDPSRFWAHFVAALQTAGADIGEGIATAFRGSRPPPIESLLTELINEIASFMEDRAELRLMRSRPVQIRDDTARASGRATADPYTGPDLVVILDDYHFIAAQPIHNALDFLLDHLPRNMHLVIATRSDPPLHLARLRGRGQLTELRAADLRFTLDEIDRLLNRVMGLEIQNDDVVTLTSRTEGWIAGLKMAGIAMRSLRAKDEPDRERIADFIQAFTGSNHYVLDYLVEEVLEQRPQGTREFLLRTSILDRLSGPLCDAVTSQNNGQQVLEQLEHANLFIVPLDAKCHWYRYHHLFAELLRLRLQRAYPDLVPVLHHRASEWHERQGFMAPAIHHALSAGDADRAANLIETAAEAVCMRSELATFLNWVEALPEHVRRSKPLLCVYHALALLLSGQPLSVVESALQHANGSVSESVSGGLAVFRALIAVYRGDTRRCAELSHQALEIIPEKNIFLRSVVAGILGLAYLYSGDTVAATQALEEAARIGKKAGNLMNTVLALCHLAELSALSGQLYEAKARYEEAVQMAKDVHGQSLPIAGVALIGLGGVLQQWNALDVAERYLLEGVRLAHKVQEAAAIRGYIALAQIWQVKGESAAALEAIQKAQQIAVRFDAMEMDDGYVALQKARLMLTQGKVEAAVQWVRERELDRRHAATPMNGRGRGVSWFSLLRALENITLARVYLAQKQPSEALAVLKQIMQSVGAGAQVPEVIELELQVLRALVLHAVGDSVQALTALDRALSLAEPGGFVRIFLDEGEPMMQLLYEAGARGTAGEYVGRLLAAFDFQEKDGTAGGSVLSPDFEPSSLIEPLSEREVEVLQLIGEGLSNQEVAERLYLSLHTVKWHTGNIYGKLGVKNRTQAIAKARAFGVLATK